MSELIYDAAMILGFAMIGLMCLIIIGVFLYVVYEALKAFSSSCMIQTTDNVTNEEGYSFKMYQFGFGIPKVGFIGLTKFVRIDHIG